MCSTQCQVRYCVCVQNIVCVPHCYLRKRPGSNPRFSLLSFLQYSAALAVLVLCAYCTSVSVQTASQAGVCSVGLPLAVRSGVWSSLLAPLTTFAARLLPDAAAATAATEVALPPPDDPDKL